MNMTSEYRRWTQADGYKWKKNENMNPPVYDEDLHTPLSSKDENTWPPKGFLFSDFRVGHIMKTGFSKNQENNWPNSFGSKGKPHSADKPLFRPYKEVDMENNKLGQKYIIVKRNI